MKYLTLNLEEEIALLERYKVTPNELMFVKTLLFLQNERNEELFKSYIETLYSCGIKIREIIVSLQDKGIILKSFKIPKEGQAFSPYDIPFNQNFIKNLYKSSFELGKELFEVYPQFTTINGNLTTLRGVSKHFDSLEDCYLKYGKSIGWNQERHSKIVDLINWSKEHDLIKQSLSSFVINQAWLDLEAIKNGDNANVNFDAIKLV